MGHFLLQSKKVITYNIISVDDYLHFFLVDEEEEDDSNDESNDEEEIEHIQDDFEPETNDKSNDKEEVEHIQDDFEPDTTDTILKHVSPAAATRFTAMAPPDFSPIERQSRSASMNISNRSFKSPRTTSKSPLKPLNNSNYPNRSLKEIRMNSPKTSNRSMNNSPARSSMVKVCDI